MKRMLPLLLLISAIEISGFTFLGKYIFESGSLELILIYMMITFVFVMFFIMRTIDFFACYYPNDERGERFSKYISVLSNVRIDFYNYIDSYDLTSVKNKFKQFWAKQ